MLGSFPAGLTILTNPMPLSFPEQVFLLQDIVTRGGRCLIPVFALGRAQELLLILDEYWASHPELHEIPIYYASSLAKKCMAVYQVPVSFMSLASLV